MDGIEAELNTLVGERLMLELAQLIIKVSLLRTSTQPSIQMLCGLQKAEGFLTHQSFDILPTRDIPGSRVMMRAATLIFLTPTPMTCGTF